MLLWGEESSGLGQAGQGTLGPEATRKEPLDHPVMLSFLGSWPSWAVFPRYLAAHWLGAGLGEVRRCGFRGLGSGVVRGPAWRRAGGRTRPSPTGGS